ncbi:MAG: glycosyltransferase family 39 protein [Patescibacteria group bacterium]
MSKHLSLLFLYLIAAVSFALMLNASFQESATMDELAHIPAGYGYVKYLDFRLNPEHPPLVKALAAFPLLFQKLNFPTDKSPWQTDINGQWAAGAQFLYESGNNADTIIQWSRLGPMLLTLILIIFIYIWSKELIGRWWALFPTFLFAFSPTVLTHGHYVTTDIGAALGIFIATYYFVKFLFGQSRRHLIFAGLAFGIAQSMKFSAFLLIPFFIFLITVFLIWKIYHDWRQTAPSARLKRFSIRGLRYFKSISAIFIIGYILIYAIYFLFTINYPIEKQVADTKFILTSFSGAPAEINIWMAGNKILRPLGQYLLGVLMVLQRSSGGNTGYFLGEVSAGGWWYYFPIVFILKEPVPSLILIFIALFLSVWGIIRKLQTTNYKLQTFMDYLGNHFAEFSMLSFAIFYWLYSIKSPLNIGIRHLMPTMPFIYILAASALKKWINYNSKVIFKSAVIAILIIWYLAETFLSAPYYLSYFNQISGGVENGYKYVTDSNYDWGQDLKRLKNFVENPPAGEKINKIAIDYFGGGSPKYYLNDKFEQWQSSKGNPKDYNIEWLAISINNLQGALGKLHPGQQRNPEDEYQWLKEIKNPYEPDYKAGTSIFIYKL